LVVLDTLPDFFGGSEVDRRQTSQFIRMLDGLGMVHNCGIVCAAHPSMRGRATRRLDSGNTGIEGKMRARLTIHDPATTATRMKPARNAPTGSRSIPPKGVS
jgi:RecA-family ATPase